MNGVPEAEVRQVEGTYEDTKSRMLCGSGISGEFEVNVGMTHEPIFVYRCGGSNKQ